MKKTVTLACLAITLLALPALILADDHGGKRSIAEENPLVHEMIILDGVFREVVSGVAMSDGESVHEALEKMHGTMEKTHEGVHEGTVKIRKNADKLDEFVKMDKEFHENLERLAVAAHKNDSESMLQLTKWLLDGCVSCHAKYR